MSPKYLTLILSFLCLNVNCFKDNHLETTDVLAAIEFILSCYGDVFQCTQNGLERLQDELDEEKINEPFNYLNEKLEEVNEKLNEIQIQLANIDHQLQHNQFYNQLRKLNEKIIFLESHYKNYEDMVLYSTGYDNKTVQKYANSFIGTEMNSPNNLMEIIFQIVVTKTSITSPQNFLVSYSKFLETTENNCQMQLSPSEIMYNFYKLIVLFEAKTFGIVQYGYVLKKRLSNNFKIYRNEMIQMKNKSLRRINRITKIFKQILPKITKAKYACNLDDPKPDSDYIEFKRFIQGIILSQQNLDSKNDCYDSCASYTHIEKIYNCNKHEWCRKQSRCNTITNCELVNVQSACLSKSKYKRYEKIIGNTIKYDTKKCRTTPQPLESWNFNAFWSCEYCYCQCNEGQTRDSDRFLSLRLSKANFRSNRAVIGLRFIKINRIVHLQVQEGKVGKYGGIEKDTIQWVPIPYMSVISSKFVPEQDYHVFSYTEKGVDLDDLIVEEGFVITGVRFKKVGSKVHLEAQKCAYNATSGQINPEYCEYIDKLSSENIKTQIKLYNPKVPPACTPLQTFGDQKFIEFTSSDKFTDAGQTTVPFIDRQEVKSKYPLSGVGLHFRGDTNCGGFIAPKIFTYHFETRFDYLINTFKSISAT